MQSSQTRAMFARLANPGPPRERPPVVAYVEELWQAARESMTYSRRWHQTYPKTKVSYCVCPLCKQYRKLLAARSTSVRDLV